MAYAWITIAFVTIFSLVMVSQMVFTAPAHIQREPRLIRKLIEATLLTSGLLLIYPVFVLMWFRRRRIREELREWE